MTPYVARGLAPVGVRSAPKTYRSNSSETPHAMGLRLLRSRTGASPLATSMHLRSRYLIYTQISNVHPCIFLNEPNPDTALHRINLRRVVDPRTDRHRPGSRGVFLDRLDHRHQSSAEGKSRQRDRHHVHRPHLGPVYAESSTPIIAGHGPPCRSRLAGDGGGTVDMEVTNTALSPASRLLQNRQGVPSVPTPKLSPLPRSHPKTG